MSNEEVTTNVNDDEDGLQEIDAYVEEIDGERNDNQPRGEIAFGGFVKGGIEGHTPLINGTALVKPGACNPTELAILFNTVFVHFPLFGAAMQWLTVVYLFSFSVFFVVSFKKHPDQPWPQFLGGLNIDNDDDDEREEGEGKAGAEIEESFGLLWSDEDREEEV